MDKSIDEARMAEHYSLLKMHDGYLSGYIIPF